MGSGLEEITITPLARIAVSGGDVWHAMKSGDPGFSGFGEAYFSWVEKGAIKAWKQHHRMTLNLIVPVGEVRFVFVRDDSLKTFREEIVGVSRYARLTVSPGIWFGFQGLATPQSLVLNIADISHDPDEVFRRELKEIKYDWS